MFAIRLSIFGFGLALASQNASAQLWDPIADFEAAPRFEAQDGSFVVKERLSPFGTGVDYLVDILGGDPIHGMGFSFQAAPDEVLGPTVDAFSAGNWASAYVSKDEWNEGYVFAMGANTVSSLELGTFQELFGNEDNMAVLYYDTSNGFAAFEEPFDNDEAEWGPFSAFSFSRGGEEFFSNALSLGSNGQLLATTVPEPSTFMLGLSMSLALGLRRTRGRS